MADISDASLAGKSDAPKSVLTEATRRVDVLHISLVGMTAIIVVLLMAVALPVFGYEPVTHLPSLLVITAATFGGIGYLYYLNYGVHKMVADHASLTEVLVNGLGQGFLSFDIHGNCDDVYSQACLDLLGGSPAGKNIVDVLRIPEEGRADFREWLDVLFMPDHAVGFSDVVGFLPQFFPHPQGHRISLEYRPIYGKTGLVRVVLIATDETEEFDAQQLAKQRQNYADMICRIFRERNQFLATITHVRQFLEEAGKTVKREHAAPLLRFLHTLKAAVKHFHLDELGDTVHRLELELRAENMSDQEFASIVARARNEVDEGLKAVLAQIRELIGQDYERRGNMHEIEESSLYGFIPVMKTAGVRQDVVDHYLRFIVAVPVQDCLRQFDRELIDLAEITGKQVKPVKYIGSNPPVLMRVLHPLVFSLTHICRNIIDHGVEAAVTRLARGKDPAAQVTIGTDVVEEQGRKLLLLTIEDDGAGIDPSLVRAKLSVTAPNGDWRDKDDHGVIQNIFSWGFSTRDSVSDLSGHGVGMEAVEREVQNLGGKIEVFSELYRGTRFEIRVPYIMSI